MENITQTEIDTTIQGKRFWDTFHPMMENEREENMEHEIKSMGL